MTHTLVADYMKKYFPDTLILPTLGNNDVKYHYQVPGSDHKDEFYSYMFNEWFIK